MADESLVAFVERWQTGAFLVLVSVLCGVGVALAARSVAPPFGPVLGFLGGGVLGFLALSYLLYGR
ncbi:MAG: hypothetical protein ABEJ06_04425 [Haloarculaceae archaeon]